MFRKLHKPGKRLTIFVDDKGVEASEGDSVSTALLCAGRLAVRKTAVTDSPRGAYCGMGVCFDCLVTIDGEGNRQACLTLVRDGMRIVTGLGRRDLFSETERGARR